MKHSLYSSDRPVLANGKNPKVGHIVHGKDAKGTLLTGKTEKN